MKRKLAALSSVVLALASLSPAKPPDPGCGTSRWRAAEQRFLSRQARLQPLRRKAELRRSKDAGDIAVIDDAGGVISRLNPFSLSRRLLTFEPAESNANSYRFTVSDLSFDEQALAGARLDLGDDATQSIALPFAFPFFGANHREVWINSDGNLTFGEGEQGNRDRSFGRLAGLLPRIAALFSDLDPSQSDFGVRVARDEAKVVITWHRVPVYSDYGFGALQTFQVRLYPSGRIEIAYDAVSVADAVVGISPGQVKPGAQMISFLTAPDVAYSAAFGERFSFNEEIDLALAAQRFYETHEDAYDFLVFYNTFNVPAGIGAVAYELTLRNQDTGFNEEKVEIGAEYGSRRRLQAIANMGQLNQYPADPRAAVPARVISGDTPLSLLAHELGHRWLAYTQVSGPNPNVLLGRANAHWNFNFNTDASVLEGNRITDLGPDATMRFTTSAAVQQFSALDQYLMGLRPASDVGPSFVVTDSSVMPGRTPQPFFAFSGVRSEFRVDDIIAAHGLRRPDDIVAQRRFRVGFVLIAPNADPTADQIEQLDAFRREISRYFDVATGGRLIVDTQLRRAATLSAWPAAGFVKGTPSQLLVQLDQPAATDVAFAITTTNGVVDIPPFTVVPAGSREQWFPVTPLQEGAGDIVLRSDNESYEVIQARAQVRGSAAEVQVLILSGDRQTNTGASPLATVIVVEVADLNRTHYPAMTLIAEPSMGGSVDRPETVTDEFGRARLQWTPGAGDDPQLRISIKGHPSSGVVVRVSAASDQAKPEGSRIQ